MSSSTPPIRASCQNLPDDSLAQSDAGRATDPSIELSISFVGNRNDTTEEVVSGLAF